MRAAAVARDGDTVEIAGGDYHGDVAVWRANRLRIVGLAPRPHLFGDGRDAEGKGIWVVRGDDTVIENVEISGAQVVDRNGAAIRLEGRNLVLRDAYLHDNENGLLTGAKADSEVTIEHCELARNGNGDGFTHNLYVGAIAKLTVTCSYLHHAVAGHNLKSRAAISVVSDSRLADEADGRASYEADFPNGGDVVARVRRLGEGARRREHDDRLVRRRGTGERRHHDSREGQHVHQPAAAGRAFPVHRPGTTIDEHQRQRVRRSRHAAGRADIRSVTPCRPGHRLTRISSLTGSASGRSPGPTCRSS